MYGSPYGYGMGGGYMNNYNNQNNQDQTPEDQQSFTNTIRTLVSGLSAVTGISFGLSTLFGLLYKAIKLLNIFKGKKETEQLLDAVWKQTVRKHSRRGFWMMFKILIVAIICCSIYLFSHSLSKKEEESKRQQETVQENEKEEDKEISIEDFMFQRKSVKQNSEIIDEEVNEESTQGEEESIKLGSVYELNDSDNLVN
ncbi:unnamed protein product [Moneuplotes crassus]|uniref:Transmembrane protein n=1 Tax=Euplotes crassus TaxID=5936 RepID=A0AAD1XRV7_EUPCR|nr:unnamed protein product [Moneuplotes crassus]